jgi:predicted lactoylglutathione lyase
MQKIFVNLPVSDLDKAKAFYIALGSSLQFCVACQFQFCGSLTPHCLQ